MASSAFTKLIRNRSRCKPITQQISVAHLTTTTTTTSSSAATTSPHPLFFLQPPQIHEPKPQHPEPCVQFGIYPSFSFQHFLSPVPPPFAPDGVDDVAEEDPNMIWADSVKKKRKKKMNKHKLKKQRKRLRRKTK